LTAKEEALVDMTECVQYKPRPKMRRSRMAAAFPQCRTMIKILSASAIVTMLTTTALADPRIASTNFYEVCSPGYAKAHRSESYGGLAPRHGFQRDHDIPLCLGGADNRANLMYQPLAEAHLKDAWEGMICRAVCRNHTMRLKEGQRFFLDGRWR
jgi:hypothetical protein